MYGINFPFMIGMIIVHLFLLSGTANIFDSSSCLGKLFLQLQTHTDITLWCYAHVYLHNNM